MHAVTDALLEATRTQYQLHTRMLLLDEDDAPIDELSGEDGYLLDATVSMDRTRLPIRTANVNVSNASGLWTPNALSSGPLGLGKRFQVDYGVGMAAAIEWVTLGRFMVDRPQVSFPDETLRLTASDYWKIGYKRKLRKTIAIDAGTRLEEVVRLLAGLAGFREDRMGFNHPDKATRWNDSDVVLQATIILPFGVDILAELKRIVEEHAHEVYCDWDGWLTLRHAPYLCGSPDCRLGGPPHLGGIDETQVPFSMTTGEDAVLLGITKDWNDDRLYNAVVVVAQSVQRPTVSAEWRNLNPDSPAYNPLPGTDPLWPNGGPLGDRMLAVQYTARLADEFAAYQYAEHLGFENGLVESSYALRTASLPHLVPGDLVSLVHPESGTDAIVMVDAITIGTTVDADQDFDIKELHWLSPPS